MHVLLRCKSRLLSCLAVRRGLRHFIFQICVSSLRVQITKRNYGQVALQGDQDRRQLVEYFQPPEHPWEYYRYNALPQKSSMIRLVELLPGGTLDTVRCHVREVDLDDLPRSQSSPPQSIAYEALSYTWDSQIFYQFVWCDGKVLPITQNLHDALKRIRQPGSSIWLWVDAICINQSDTAERNCQIGLMRQIFNRANQVIAWLGEEDADTKSAFDLVEKISAVTTSVTPEAVRDNFWTPQLMEDMGLPRMPDAQWFTLSKLFGRPYFKRIWVVQELVVSRNAVARYGSLTIRWEHIDHVGRLLLATGWRKAFNIRSRTSPRAPVFQKTISNIKRSFSEFQGRRGMTLGLLLCVTRRFLSTDPRDKVVALIGLANNVNARNAQPILPNYSKSTADVYRDVTGFSIVQERSLTLLSVVEDISDRQISHLPSWVPDYSVWQSEVIFGYPISRIQYRAAGASEVSVRWSAGSSVLAVDGIQYDEVENVSSNIFDDTQKHKEIILEWLQMAEPLMRNGTIGIDAFWRTLLGDCDRDICPAPEEWANYFASYLSLVQKQEVSTSRATTWAEDTEPGNASVFQASLEYVAWRRRFFTTRKGLIGLGRPSMKPGDSVCILSGGHVPFLLRKDGTHHRFVGESYVHGLMKGEAMQEGICMEEFRIR